MSHRNGSWDVIFLLVTGIISAYIGVDVGLWVWGELQGVHAVLRVICSLVIGGGVWILFEKMFKFLFHWLWGIRL